MSFTNHGPSLKKMRGRSRPIQVWKTGTLLNFRTGDVETYYDKHRCVWEGTVKPHRKRLPLKHGGQCTAGLYFYVGKPSATEAENPKLVVAIVKPEHVIAVSELSEYEQLICCTEATVIKLNNLEQKTRCLQRAKEQLEERVELVKHWHEGGREEWEEAYQRMKNEFCCQKMRRQKM